MERIKVTVTVRDAHLGQIETVAQKLADLGLAIEQTLPTIGVITGTVRSEQVQALRQVSEVELVAAEQSYRLPPPSSNIQ
ncbi:ketohydroxyglutarate aldolase [Synechococcales cyanobacterium C]|uniref:Ketohydroxyglutarate aldolase n=1 Tax=Petrachloros mirabilis ULC683 TaxID=2781853 RepID=A0A8K1ZWA8_9CYAN|nr:ketohydroxyglutarate aldolase [Petrachloros mirabilis]NCJ05311.1 ketohydroxyglutarate aldolase [Petrachloros mirabilis ULC683]